MIVKSLSRNAGSVGQLIRYIFRNRVVPDHNPLRESYRNALNALHIDYTERDLVHLQAELFDRQLWEATKDMNSEECWQYILDTFYSEPLQKLTHNASTLVFGQHVRSVTVADVVAEFEEHENKRLYKRKDNVVQHVVLSWHKDDTLALTNNVISDLVERYMAEFSNSKITGITHNETDHTHVHLVVGSQLNGLSSRISKERFQEIKVALQRYQQKYPELTSLPEHSLTQARKARSAYSYIKNERSSVKNQLIDLIETIRPQSSEHLFNELSQQGFTVYERAGKKGLIHSETGLKFRMNRLPIDMEHLEAADMQLAKEEGELSMLRQLRERSAEKDLENEMNR